MRSRADPDPPPDPLTPWKRWVCHVGYASEGVIYLLGFCLVVMVEFPFASPLGMPTHVGRVGGVRQDTDLCTAVIRPGKIKAQARFLLSLQVDIASNDRLVHCRRCH